MCHDRMRRGQLMGPLPIAPAPPAGFYYGFAVGFGFSCLGFLFFLSFFWEWLPLPMAEIPHDRGGD